jgi:hypothetical protein
MVKELNGGGRGKCRCIGPSKLRNEGLMVLSAGVLPSLT